jgi:O-antigen/teichoic acid export membrane protein
VHARKFIRDSLGYTVSQYWVRFLSTLRGVLAARLLGPAGYGSWNALMLIMDYGIQAHSCTFAGLDQAVPARIVDGDEARLARVKRAGLFNVLATTLLIVVACLVYFGRAHGQVREAWGMTGVAVMLACVALTVFSYYHHTLLRSHGNMGAVSQWYLLQGTIGVSLGLGLIPWFGQWGLLWGWFTGTLIATASVVWRGRAVVPLLPRPSGDSRALLATGLPIFIYSYSNFVMRSLDRVIILKFLGTNALGLYGLAVMAVGFLLTMPDAVSYVLYPRLLRRFRESGNQPPSIRDHVHRAMRAQSLIVPALCALGYLAADDMVSWLLPRFAEGVPALRILCFSAAGLSLGNLGSIVQMTLGRQLVLVPVAVGMTALGVALDLVAVWSGHGIRGVAWATFFTYAINSAVLVLLADAAMGASLRARLGFLARLFLPVVVAIPLAYLFERFFPGYGPSGPVRWLRLVGSMLLWLALYGLVAAPLARGIGLRQLASEFDWPWSATRRQGGTRD